MEIEFTQMKNHQELLAMFKIGVIYNRYLSAPKKERSAKREALFGTINHFCGVALGEWHSYRHNLLLSEHAQIEGAIDAMNYWLHFLAESGQIEPVACSANEGEVKFRNIRSFCQEYKVAPAWWCPVSEDKL